MIFKSISIRMKDSDLCAMFHHSLKPVNQNIKNCTINHSMLPLQNFGTESQEKSKKNHH